MFYYAAASEEAPKTFWWDRVIILHFRLKRIFASKGRIEFVRSASKGKIFTSTSFNNIFPYDGSNLSEKDCQ